MSRKRTMKKKGGYVHTQLKSKSKTRTRGSRKSKSRR